MKHFSKITWVVYVALAICLHAYTIYYVKLHYGSGWAMTALFLPGVSQLFLCFVTVVVTDVFFNQFTNIMFSSIIVFSAVRFVFEDLHDMLLERRHRADNGLDDDHRMARAMEYAEREDYRPACRIFLQMYKENSMNATACFGAGVCLVKLGKEQLGLNYIKKAAFLGNTEAQTYLFDVTGRGRKELLYAV